MNQIKPLLFLTFNQAKNGIKRSLSSPRRLVTLIAIVGYYFFIFIRPALASGSTDKLPMYGDSGLQLAFPPLQVIEALVFTFLAGMSMLMLLGIMTANTMYKPADVDVLFPTPISAKAVLTFRLLRDYLATLIVPLFITIFGLRPAKLGWERLFSNMPEYSGLALKLLTVSWLLISLCWVSISYAVSLYVNRSDARTDKVRRNLLVGLVLFIVGVVYYIYSSIQANPTQEGIISFLSSPITRSIFFLATFATQFVMSPLQPNGLSNALIGLGGLIGIFSFAWFLAMKQIGWLYDQAAIKALSRDKSQQMQKSGDYIGVLGERARQGKLKFKSGGWFSRQNWSGSKALIWKEVCLHFRSMKYIVFLNFVIGVIQILMPAMMPGRNGTTETMMVFMACIYAFSSSLMSTVSGYIELIKRIDLLKPLPFQPRQIVFSEVIAKGLLSIPAVPLYIVVLVLKPALWQTAIACLIGVPSLSILMSACAFTVMVIFPDVNEMSQRQFKVLLTMLAVLLASLIPGLLAAGAYALTKSPLITGIFTSISMLVIAGLVTLVATPIYENFNPTD
jgi:hypothetical protein